MLAIASGGIVSQKGTFRGGSRGFSQHCDPMTNTPRRWFKSIAAGRGLHRRGVRRFSKVERDTFVRRGYFLIGFPAPTTLPVPEFSSPTSPSCFDPVLPSQTTLHRTGLSGSSSKTISTIWPRLNRKLPRTRNPFFEKSITRHGCRLRSRTKLARCLHGLRLKKRCSGTGIVS